MERIQILSKHPNETKEIAQYFKEVLQFSDVVILEGNLGTGKTLFVKSIAEAKGYDGDVTSPTFNLANFYEIANGNILHIDAYRIESIKEFRDLGLYDYFDESVVFIEWGTKLIEEFSNYLLIKLEYVDGNDDHRKITFESIGNNHFTNKILELNSSGKWV